MSDLFLVDTTLRDGEQAPGVVFNLREKITIARLLDLCGVDIIEAGTPAMGETEQSAISAIAGLGLRARITTWNRMVPADIRASLECGVKDVHISAPVSGIQIRYKLQKTRQWVLDRTREAVRFARDCGCNISVGAEDASRADPLFLEEFARAAREEGARRLRYADTVGVLYPLAVYERLSALGEKKIMEIEFHGHNDFGMAVANSIAAVKAGIKYVDTTVGGLGERAGNADMKKFIQALALMKIHNTGWKHGFLHRLEQYVATAANRTAPGEELKKTV
ncbi:homocitrate synthase [Desulfocucumis palustris]|uniref:Homocitrate synthase n=1 Tax=Desulfocucumis palustris TaxID=1898651 RepID=A0A2L2XBM0_9FIRM|nr:homocitrate synthase [Desulfocucumis palustris]GBF33083.1 homocitrate synthase [Desulfocucumis palustris]